MLSIITIVIDNLLVTQRYISSIRQYTTGDYELILIDNGSSNKKAIKYFKDTADIYFRFDTLTDLVKAWNKGIQLSNGEYIVIANNDMVVPPQWFKLLKEVLDARETAGMVSPLTFWLLKSVFVYGNLRNLDRTFKQPFKLQKFKDIVWGEFCLYKRNALADVGYFCDLYKKFGAEDLEMNFQLYAHGYDIFVDPRVFVYHQGHATHHLVDKAELDEISQKNFELFKSRWPEYTKNWD
ncbi:MAG: glycosyltransferase family 2 protein [Candidatus Helarchaeota archaeon]